VILVYHFKNVIAKRRSSAEAIPAETMIHLDKEIASGNHENHRGKRARVPSQ
jgi:hypothetical protein